MEKATPRRDLILRWIMAGPLTLVAAVLTMASAPLWMAEGAAGVDNLIFLILLFPAFWAVYIFYTLMETKPVRGLIVMVSIILVNAVTVYQQF